MVRRFVCVVMYWQALIHGDKVKSFPLKAIGSPPPNCWGEHMSTNSRTHNAIHIGGLGIIFATGALFSGQLKPTHNHPSTIITE
jgi:hypothetical protein